MAAPAFRAGSLPKDERLLGRFFRWGPLGEARLLLLLDEYMDVPDGETVRFARSDFDVRLLRTHLLQHGREGPVVGYSFTHPKRAKVMPTAGYVHVGQPSGGRYEARAGMDGVQAYEGDSDVMLISTFIGDSYLSKVRADIIV